MNHYIHHVPGRLRVRLPALKANAAAGWDLENAFAEVAGVHDVDVNPLTGSVLVHYDRHAETAKRIMESCVWEVQDFDHAEFTRTPGRKGGESWRTGR